MLHSLHYLFTNAQSVEKFSRVKKSRQSFIKYRRDPMFSPPEIVIKRILIWEEIMNNTIDGKSLQDNLVN